MDEALENAIEVLSLTIEGRIDEKLDLPIPSTRRNAHLIPPVSRVQAALLLRFMKGDYKTADIARTLETSWPSISRLEDPHHWPSLRQLERTAVAIGQRLILSMEPL